MKSIYSRIFTIPVLMLVLSDGFAQQADRQVSPVNDPYRADIQTTAAPPAVKHEILLMLQRMDLAVENRDIDQIMELFSRDPDVTFIGSKGGKIARGPGDIRKVYEGLFSSQGNTSFVWKSPVVNVSGNVAWLFAFADLVHEDEHGITRVPYRLTSVFRLENGQWKWLQFHGSEPINNT